jgi:hypothetical protein
MFCTLGASGAVIQVPAGQAFICPVCGKPLGPATQRRRRWRRGAAIFGFSVVWLSMAAFLAGASIAGEPILAWIESFAGVLARRFRG